MIKKVITVLIVIAVLVGLYQITSKKPTFSPNLDLNQNISFKTNPATTGTDTTEQNPDLILFYGNTCPHCKLVEDFISKNKIDQKLKIGLLEVYENKSNTTIFANMVQKICPDQLNSSGLPVPFLIDQKDKKCTVGDQPVIQYLTEKSK